MSLESPFPRSRVQGGRDLKSFDAKGRGEWRAVSDGRPQLFQRWRKRIQEAIGNKAIDRPPKFSTSRGIAALAAKGGVLVPAEEPDAVDKAFTTILGLAAVLMPNRKAA